MFSNIFFSIKKYLVCNPDNFFAKFVFLNKEERKIFVPHVLQEYKLRRCQGDTSCLKCVYLSDDYCKDKLSYLNLREYYPRCESYISCFSQDEVINDKIYRYYFFGSKKLDTLDNDKPKSAEISNFCLKKLHPDQAHGPALLVDPDPDRINDCVHIYFKRACSELNLLYFLDITKYIIFTAFAILIVIFLLYRLRKNRQLAAAVSLNNKTRLFSAKKYKAIQKERSQIKYKHKKK